MGKDRPILWSTGMVDVIMNTQPDTEPAAIDPEKPFKGVTRRIIGDTVGQRFTEAEHDGDMWGFSGPGGSAVIRAPYQLGDRLWVRVRIEPRQHPTARSCRARRSWLDLVRRR